MSLVGRGRERADRVDAKLGIEARSGATALRICFGRVLAAGSMCSVLTGAGCLSGCCFEGQLHDRGRSTAGPASSAHRWHFLPGKSDSTTPAPRGAGEGLTPARATVFSSVALFSTSKNGWSEAFEEPEATEATERSHYDDIPERACVS